MKSIKQILEDEILLNVSKPARYIGGEINVAKKLLNEIGVRLALAFPDIYDIGMSHFGIKILYEIINKIPWAYCERTFAPWMDMETKMREKNIPLFTLETFSPLREMDIIGFSLQYELSYTNLLNMLNLAQIPFYTTERFKGNFPFVIAGGPSAFASEPLHEFIDFFILGDAEEVFVGLLEEFRRWKREEPFGDNQKRKYNFLNHIASSIKGIYVPSLYEVEYFPNGKIKKIFPKYPSIPQVVEKNVLTDINYENYPVKPLVPLIEVVHDRFVLEVMRGCTHGCRFCQAGMLYRPRRERPIDYLLAKAIEGIASTGWEEISLTSLSTGDYHGLDELISRLLGYFGERRASISLSSLRADSFSVSIAEKVQQVKKTGLTFAVETASQRLRQVINKQISNDDLLSAVRDAGSKGWNLLKLYFMIGLPTETMEDIDEMIELIYSVYHQFKKSRGHHVNINVAIACFVPKAHTPFQWERFHNLDEFFEKARYIKSKIKNRSIKLSFHEPERSYLEAVFARGDRRLSKVLVSAWRLGCKFDYWNENFNLDIWKKAFNECGIAPDEYAYRKFDYSDILPWEHVSPKVSKEFLAEEHRKALRGEWTADCYETGCLNCGNVCPPGQSRKGEYSDDF